MMKFLCDLNIFFHPNYILSKIEKPFLEFRNLLYHHKEDLDLQSAPEVKCVTLLDIVFDLKGVLRKKSVDTLPNQ